MIKQFAIETGAVPVYGFSSYLPQAVAITSICNEVFRLLYAAVLPFTRLILENVFRKPII